MGGSGFPAMRGREFLRHLERKPLGYRPDPGRTTSGSHRTMVSDEFPELLFAFHDDADIPPGLVRKVLTKDVGLSKEQALAHLRGDLKWPPSQ